MTFRSGWRASRSKISQQLDGNRGLSIQIAPPKLMPEQSARESTSELKVSA